MVGLARVRAREGLYLTGFVLPRFTITAWHITITAWQVADQLLKSGSRLVVQQQQATQQLKEQQQPV